MKTQNTFIAFAICLIATSSGFADSGKDVALILKTAGKVGVNKQGRSTWSTARRGQRVHSGEIVKTGDRALAALVFTDDKSLMKIRSNSNVTVYGKREKNSIAKRIQISFGEIWAKVTRQNVKLRIESPSGVATVKGTELNCLYADDNFFVLCQKGIVDVTNQFGSMLLGANEMARLTKGLPPERISGNPDKIFDMTNDGDGKQMEIEYEDEDGNKKTLILDFD